MGNEMQIKDAAQERGLSRLENSLFAIDKCKHYQDLAQQLSTSTLVPKHFQNKPMDLFLAMEHGYQLGLTIAQAIQAVCVINGKTCIYGDDMLAVVMTHPEFEDIIESPIMQGQTVVGYSCTVKRKGKSDYTKTFTLDMAKKAGLIGRPGPWTLYTDRMLQMRCRGFALRDRFPDALRGIKLREEVEDYIDGEVVVEKTTINGLSRADMLKQDIKQRQGDIHGQAEVQGDSINEANEDQDNHLASQADTKPNEHDESSHGARRDDSPIQHRQVDNSPAAPEQIDMISSLIVEKGFDAERTAKAFKYFEIKDLEELTKDKAERFIKMLGK